MPKTPHPKDNAPDSVLQPKSYNIKVNPNTTDNQASETYQLDSSGNQALGVGGETRGYGKTQKSFTRDSALDPTEYKAMSASDPIFKDTNNYHNDRSETRNVVGDRGLITRQVATYEADKFLNLNSIAEEKYGVGQDKKVIGVSIQADGTGVTSNSGFFNIDYSDPRVQRGLSDLEVSDFITGQFDRHNGNIFIDPAIGKVTGIDNDLGFPEVSRDTLLQDMALNGKMVTGMPRMMHKDTADKILNANLDEFRKTLSKSPPKGGPSPLSKDAIDGAVGRLKALQDELKKGNSSGIQVVNAFDQNTYNTAISQQTSSFHTTHAKAGDKQNAANTPLNQLQGNREVRLACEDCPKTSYVGKIAMTRLKNELTPQNERMAMVNNGPQANRVANSRDLEAYQKMNPVQRKAFDKSHAELNKLEGQLEKLEKEVGHLQHPGLKDRLASITKGGVKNAMQQDNNKIAQLKTQITNAKADLQQKVDTIVPVVNQMPVRPHVPAPRVAPLQPPGNTTTNTTSTGVNQTNVPKKITAKVQVVKKETGKVQVGDGKKTVLSEPKLDETTAQKNKAMVGELQNKMKRSVRQTNPELDHSKDQSKGIQIGKKTGTGVHT
jgi:hypothetical protein